MLRASEDRFLELPDFDYDRSTVDAGEIELGAVDVASDGSETFLLLHGEPTWSYLYRTLIPGLRSRGRVVTLDLPGLGRSEKWPSVDDYTYHRLFDAIEGAIDALELTGITLVCQDWGGLLGLPVAAANPDRFARLVPMNTGLFHGHQEMPEVWLQFREMIRTTEDLDVGRIVQSGCTSTLSDAEVAAYNVPFPDASHLAGVRAYPDLVPADPDHPVAEPMQTARERLSTWEKPAFVLFGDSDPITRPSRDDLRELIPTATDQPDIWIEGAGHFLQEDSGPEIADRIVDFVDRT